MFGFSLWHISVIIHGLTRIYHSIIYFHIFQIFMMKVVGLNILEHRSASKVSMLNRVRFPNKLHELNTVVKNIFKIIIYIYKFDLH